MPAVDCFFVLKTVPDVLCGPQVGGSCPGLHTYKRCWPSRTRTAKMLSKRWLTSLLKRSARRWAKNVETTMNAARCLTRTAKRWRSRFPWKSVPALISQGTVQPLFFSSTISLSHFIVVLQGADHFKACIWAARIPVRYESCISVCCEEKVFFMMILFLSVVHLTGWLCHK